MSSEKLAWYEQVLERNDLSPQYRNLLEKRQLETRLSTLVTPEVRRLEPLVDMAIPRLADRILRGKVVIENVEANLLLLSDESQKK